MNINQTIDSTQKYFESNIEKYSPAAVQEAFQPMIENMKAWGELIQRQNQASQNMCSETFEAFKNAKEPQSVFHVMNMFSQNLMMLASSNMRDGFSLGMSQFKGTVNSISNKLPASDAVNRITEVLNDSVSKMESAMEENVNGGITAIKKARSL